MTDRPARWPETPDIVERLMRNPHGYVCIKRDAAEEIVNLRDKPRSVREL